MMRLIPSSGEVEVDWERTECTTWRYLPGKQDGRGEVLDPLPISVVHSEISTVSRLNRFGFHYPGIQSCGV